MAMMERPEVKICDGGKCWEHEFPSFTMKVFVPDNDLDGQTNNYGFRALITIAVCADGFLYNMVRAIVGTMVYASHGKLAPEEIPALLETRDRRLTGPTMPPQGLYLNRVWYEGEVGLMMMKDAE